MTTYRSESRGFVYSAPPSEDGENRTRPKSENETEPDATEEAETTERASPELESTTATTDANWTGTVPADD
jgi:hypothetical protein